MYLQLQSDEMIIYSRLIALHVYVLLGWLESWTLHRAEPEKYFRFPGSAQSIYGSAGRLPVGRHSAMDIGTFPMQVGIALAGW